jgi:hypothetical protein
MYDRTTIGDTAAAAKRPAAAAGDGTSRSGGGGGGDGARYSVGEVAARMGRLKRLAEFTTRRIVFS